MIKCALISGRGMGLMHGGNFHSHPDAEVVAVCDMDPELLAAATEQFGVPGYSSIEELLANCDVDLMLMIVNETRRIPPLRQLLAAGQNVFTEKPLCGLEGQFRVREDDLPIAAAAISEWRDSGLKFGIDFNYRFMTHFRKLHDDVVEGRLGEIRMVRARAHFNCWSHVIDQILWNMGQARMGQRHGRSKRRGRLAAHDSHGMGKRCDRFTGGEQPLGLRRPSTARHDCRRRALRRSPWFRGVVSTARSQYL